MSELKYKEGDKVLIKDIDWYNANKSKSHGTVACGGKYFDYDMREWCGKTMTILTAYQTCYIMQEDGAKDLWTDEMIEGLVEEETKPEFDYVAAMDDLMGLDIEKSCILNDFDEYKKAVEKHGYFSEEALTRKLFINLRKNGTAQNVLENFGFNLPDGYIFKDENGNVINATKIVLEKKKKEYPKTYEECLKILGFTTIYTPKVEPMFDYDDDIIALQKLKNCRDAYWKIAGEEMSLGKPWKPDHRGDFEHGTPIKYVIYNIGTHIVKERKSSPNHTLSFPTEEMRDAFYENFKKDIEMCKKLL